MYVRVWKGVNNINVKCHKKANNDQFEQEN